MAVWAPPELKDVFLFVVANNLRMYWRRVVDDEWSPWGQMGERLFA